MASKSTYECFACKKNGFAGVRVHLDGKTESGQTIYKNEDMSPHYHQQRSSTAEEVVHQGTQQQPQSQSQQKQGSTTVISEGKLLKMVNAKLDRVINLLETLAAVGAGSAVDDTKKE
jgi:hypothetical protein